MTASQSARKVLLVTSSYPRWIGDSTTPFVHHLAQDLRALGWDVRVLAPHAPASLKRETLDGVPVERFRYLWPERQQTLCYDGGALINLRRNRWNLAKLPLLLLFQALAIARRLARGDVAVVHSHWILPQGLTAGIAARLFRVPHVATIHGGDAFALSGRWLRWCKRLACRLSDVVTVNSSATRAAVAGFAPRLQRVEYIPMGVSEDPCRDPAQVARLRSRYRSGSGPLLIFVGRLIEEKGVGDLIRAMPLLLPELPDARLVVVGEGPGRVGFEGLAATVAPPGTVAFAGWVAAAEVPCFLAAADIFVGPSKAAPDGWREAQGLTFAEAMMAGIPVVATRSGGIPDAISHERTGLLVAEDAPAEIAAAVIRLATQPEFAGRLAATGRELVVRQFTRLATAQAFVRLFEGLTVRPEPCADG